MFFFMNMLWNHPLQILSKEDYKKLGGPKKVAFSFSLVWGGAFYLLSYQL